LRGRASGFLRQNAIALLALFVALGGASYAAVNLPKNSVGAKQIRSGAVTAKKLRQGSVNSAKVKNRSLRAVDFRRGELPQGPRGVTGPTGPTGTVDVSAAGWVTNEVEYGAETDIHETTTSPVVVGRLTFEAPADGFVLVNVAPPVHAASPVTGTCTVSIGYAVDGEAAAAVGLGTFEQGDPEWHYVSIPLTDATPVEAGTHEISVTAQMNPFVSPSCEGSFGMAPPPATALFVPHGKTHDGAGDP